MPLDAGVWDTCSPPKAYACLSEGQHEFAVRATDAVGNTDPSPATSSFVVDTVAPETTVLKQPKKRIRRMKQKVGITVSFESETGAAFECKLDDREFETCTSPSRFRVRAKRGKGLKHKIAIRARDDAGNTTAPAIVKFKAIRTTE